MVHAVVGALVIGLTLGLFGSGGSIMTVPVLRYLLGHDAKVAVAESLGIVGGVALVAMLPFAWNKQVDWRNVAFFGIPGMAGTYLGAWLALYVPSPVQLSLFGGVMLLAAGMMLRSCTPEKPETATPQADTPEPEISGPEISGPETSELEKSGPKKSGPKKAGPGRLQPEMMESNRVESLIDLANPSEKVDQHALWKIVLEGVIVGVITGLVGVGGGFLIVPALTLFGGLPMRTAVGTSLAIIALKSASGFSKYLHVLEELDLSVDWPTIWLFVAVGIVGSSLGSLVGARLNQQLAKRGFALFLLVMGTGVIARELPGVLRSGPF